MIVKTMVDILAISDNGHNDDADYLCDTCKVGTG